MRGCNFAGSGGRAGIWTFIRTRLFPRIVVMTVSFMSGGGGLLSSGLGGGGGGFRAKTFRSTIPWYGFAGASGAAALAAMHDSKATMEPIAAFPQTDIPEIYRMNLQKLAL